MAKVETLAPLPCAADAVPAALQIRSTTLVSSRNTLQETGMFDAYEGHLSPEHATALSDLVPGRWVPMALGMAHYGAVERLGLSPAQARENGRRVAHRVQHGYFGTLLRTVGKGVTVWSVLPRAPSFVSRLVKGGACAVYKTGPKDARVEIHGVPIAQFAYVRFGWAGMFESTLELVARKVNVNDLSPRGTLTVACLAISWV